MIRRVFLTSLLLGILSLIFADESLDWPTWRHDNARSGVYPEDLSDSLHLQWSYKALHAPAEAWPGTAQSDWWRKRGTPEKKRITFDQSFGVVGAEKKIYFVSSADDQLRCLDLESGSLLWSFSTEGPIRLAPTIASDRILFGSDDGMVYALDRHSGKILWKVTPPKSDQKRLPGNGRIISLYPIRSGVMVRGKVAYFCSGLFPKNAGAWHCAVNVETGELLDRAAIDSSPQGYLEERDGKLFLPTGRHSAGAILAELEDSEGPKVKSPLSSLENYPFSILSTPSQFIGGGEGKVAILSAGDKKELWSAEIEGRAKSLALVQGQLVVSTDRGMIYCFGPREAKPVRLVEKSKESPDSLHDEAIKKVLAQLTHDKGYALVCRAYEDGGEVMERLTALSEMQVIGVVDTDEQASILRRRIGSRGLSNRAIVHVNPRLEDLYYVPHIFNLITSPEGLSGSGNVPSIDSSSLLRPGSGLAFFKGSEEPSDRVPEFEGTGEWTHMYADPGNTACSNDSRVGADVGLQWFGRPGPQHMMDRHLRTSPPLVKNGYMYVPGRDYLFGIDAWNGAILWEREVADFQRIGVLRDSGNLVATDEFLYCITGTGCQVLDTMTGAEKFVISLPSDSGSGSHEWGYAGVSGDRLVGSAVKKGGVYRTTDYAAIYEVGYGDNTRVTCSDHLFVSDRKSGKSLWDYHPKGSIPNPSIILSESEIIFLESHDTESLRKDTGRLDYPLLLETKGASLVSLDLQTGKLNWRRELPLEKRVQTLFVLYKEGKVVVTLSRNDVAEGAEKATLHYGIHVFGRKEGNLIWSDSRDFKRRPNLDHGEQDRHPAIVGDRLIVEPHIYELESGKHLGEFKRPKGGCGTISASAQSLYFRAGNLAAFDLESGENELINKVSRPGCWINMIPAAGLLLVPEGSSGCICNFAVQGSMAFAPRQKAE